MRIDAHQHFWIYNKTTHSWISDDMQVIRRDFRPADLEPILKESGIDGCVAVQVDQSEEETLSLLDASAKNDFIKGVVGWVDLMSPDIGERLEAFAGHERLKGFRHIVQGLPEGFLLQRKFLDGIGQLARFGFTYDILVYQDQLPEVISLVRKFPDQKFVLDHLSKPLIRTVTIEPWKKNIRQLASFGNVSCKLSGMVTEADWQQWKPEQFTPFIDIAFDAFGETRLMYGSDWPVCLVAATYKQQLAIVESYLSRLSSAEKDRVMGDNAVQFYNL